MADALSVVDRWLDALEARDLNRILDLLDDNITIETEIVRTPIKGKQVLREMLDGVLDAYDSIRVERRKIVASGRDVAVLANIKARFGKDLEMYGVKLSTAGKSIDLISAIFAEVNQAGRIARISRVRDTLSVVQQLGITQEQLTAMMDRFDQQRRAA